jgi:hypothetical protein
MPITHPNPNIREKKDEHKGYCYPAAMEETAHDNVRDACTVGWWGADSNLAKIQKQQAPVRSCSHNLNWAKI